MQVQPLGWEDTLEEVCVNNMLLSSIILHFLTLGLESHVHPGHFISS